MPQRQACHAAPDAPAMAARHRHELFAAAPDRFAGFPLGFEDLLLDFAKHRIDAETLRRRLELARAVALS
jgi:hypothetical protein